MLSLTHVSSQYTLSRRDGRVVIGCDVCLQVRQGMALLIFARYDHLWFAHAVATESLQCNGKQPLLLQPVANGDVWDVSGERLLLQIEEESPEPEIPLSHDSLCEIRLIISADTSRVYPIQPPSVVIGRALFCDIRIDDRGMAPQQAMVCKVNGQWYVHDLTCGGGEFGFQGFELISNREIRHIGGSRLEFILHKVAPPPASVFNAAEGIRNELKQRNEPPLTSGSEVAAGNGVKTLKSDRAARLIASPVLYSAAVSTTQDHAARITNSGSDSTVVAAHQMSSVDNRNKVVEKEAIRDEKVRAAAQNCLNLIASLGQLRVARCRPVWEQLQRRIKVWYGIRKAEQTFLENRRIQAFENLQTLIMVFPFEKALLLTLARMCEHSGLQDQCLHVLRILNERTPNDHIVLRSLARITLFLSEREPAYARKSEAYWRKVQELCPDEKRAIDATIRGIQSRMLSCGYKKRSPER